MNYDFSNLVENFQKSKISTREFLKEIAIYILKFPYFLGYQNDDIRHEFYAFISSRIKKLIIYYKKIDNCSFLNWFNVVLRRQFIYFIKKYNKEQNLYHQNICSLNENLGIIPEEPENNNMNLNLSYLSKKEQKVISLKFGIDLDSSLLAKLILKKIEKKKLLEQRLSSKFFKLIKIQQNILTEVDQEKIKKLKQEEHLLKNAKRKLETTVSNINIYPSNKWVGKQLGIQPGSVATYINRAKNKMQKAGLNNIMIIN